MKKQYYLSSHGTHLGPFEAETILLRLESQSCQWTDYIYDEFLGDWLMLLEHPEFSGKLAQRPASRPVDMPKAPVKTNLKDREWFVLKSGSNYGPFSKLELIQMLQEKSLFEYDYIWHSQLPSWKRVAEVSDFSKESIRVIKESNELEVTEVFFRRRYVRVNYGASLIVHDSKTVFHGQAMELSAGGAGVLIQSSNLQPGQSLFLHFQPGDGVPPFNVVCQIVSKQFVKEREGAVAPVKYGVKFMTLSQSARESIRNFTEKAA